MATYQGQSEAEQIIGQIECRRVGFFVGAGVSMIAPTCLPSWWQVNHAVIDTLTEVASQMLPNARSFADLIKKRSEDGKLPPEFAAEVLCDLIGDSYFEVLRCLDGHRPNPVHRWLAALGRARKLPAIITTNFDCLIERAFDENQTKLDVCVLPNDFAALLPELAVRMQETTAPPLLLKIHGTATMPSSCIDTLAQRKRGLHPAVMRAVAALGNYLSWVVLGYSGADLEADPNYLGFLERAASCPGIRWLTLPGQTPLPAVSRLCAAHSEGRGRVVYGVLPAWLEQLKRSLPANEPDPLANCYPETDASEFRAQACKATRQSISAWARDLEPVRCSWLLSRLLDAASYQEQARGIIQQLLGYEEILAPFARACLWADLALFYQFKGQFVRAKGLYERALTTTLDYSASGGYVPQFQRNLFTLRCGIAQTLRQMGRIVESEHQLQQLESEFRPFPDYASQLAQVMYSRAENLRALAKPAEANTKLAEAIELSRVAGNEKARASFLLLRAMWQLTDETSASRDFDEAEQVFLRLGHDVGLITLWLQRAQRLWQAGARQQGERVLEKAAALAEQVGRDDCVQEVTLVRSNWLIQKGEFDAAETLLRVVLQQARSAMDPRASSEAMRRIGHVFMYRGELAQAERNYDEALRVATEHDFVAQSATIDSDLGSLKAQQGEVASAHEHLLRALKLNQQSGDVCAEGRTLGGLGNLCVYRKQPELAIDYYERACRLFDDAGDAAGNLTTIGNYALALQQLGKDHEAEREIGRAIQLAEHAGLWNLAAANHYNYGCFLFARKRYADARQSFERAERIGLHCHLLHMAGYAAFQAASTFIHESTAGSAVPGMQRALEHWSTLSELPAEAAQAQVILSQLGLCAPS